MIVDELWYKDALTVLEIDEEIRFKPYPDSEGKLTIGIGRNLTDKGITHQTVYQMFEEDMYSAYSDVCFIFGSSAFALWSDARKVAVTSLLFNLGCHRFLSFTNMIAAIKGADWNRAADELLDSQWAKQVDPHKVPGKGRDDRLALMLRKGEYDESYKI